MNIINNIKLWNNQRKCSHKNFKDISSTTIYIDDEAKRFPLRKTFIRECKDCGLIYKQDLVYSYRTENTYSIIPSHQIKKLSKKEREKIGK